jgi:hypothetical protein
MLTDEKIARLVLEICRANGIPTVAVEVGSCRAWFASPLWFWEC